MLGHLHGARRSNGLRRRGLQRSHGLRRRIGTGDPMGASDLARSRHMPFHIVEEMWRQTDLFLGPTMSAGLFVELVASALRMMLNGWCTACRLSKPATLCRFGCDSGGRQKQYLQCHVFLLRASRMLPEVQLLETNRIAPC